MEQEIKTEKTDNKQSKPWQFKKGESGNPDGRPKGSKNFTTKVREALLKVAEGKEYTYEEAFLKAILKKAIIDQDTTIMRLIWNYLDGMPSQSVDMNMKEAISEIELKVIHTNKDEIKNRDNSDTLANNGEQGENNN